MYNITNGIVIPVTKKMSSDDPIVIYYIVEVLIAEENYIEALTQLALIIK